MPGSAFPVGEAALHPDWPQAHFNISGMFVHEPLIFHLLAVVKPGFDCRLPIEAVHGAPSVCWNAGRAMTINLDRQKFQVVLDRLGGEGIGYFPTFTNHRLVADDMQDATGNFLLDAIDRRPDLNGVIVTSDLLSDHIAKRCPRLRQVASITKVSLEDGGGKAEYYQQLEKRFFRYIPEPDDCHDLALLDKLGRDKVEIIVNENCAVDCPNRRGHYDLYARLQKANGTGLETQVRQELERLVGRCPSPLHPQRLGGHRLSCNLSRREMKAVYDMGFRHFKLQGRSEDPYTHLYDLTRYLLEPEIAAPLVFKIMCRWLNGVLTRNK
jgi:hypothetical protein